MTATWEQAKLKDVCLPVMKVDPAELGRGAIHYIDIGSVDGARHMLADVPEIQAADAPSRCRQVVHAGDTLFSTVRPYLEKIAYVDGSLDGEFASTGFCVLRPGPRLLPRYLYYFSISPLMLDQVLPFQKGVSYPAVLDKEVRATAIPIPPLDEQRRIVELLEDHLSRLDAAGAYLETGRRRLSTMEQAALANCRDGELRSLADVTEIQGGIQKQPKRAPRDNAHPFLRVANVTARGLELDDVHQIELFDGELDRLKLQAGDLLVVEGNGSASQIGRAALWDASIANCVHQNHLIRVRPTDRLLPEYLEAVWNSPENRARLTQVASSSSGLHTLSVSKLKQVSVPVPSIARQRELVDEVVAVTDIGARLGASIAMAAQREKVLRHSLLGAAFSGQLTAEMATA